MTFQKPFEEGAASREDHLVSFDTPTLTGQGDICEVSVISQISNRGFQNILKVVPLQTQLLLRHDFWFPGMNSGVLVIDIIWSSSSPLLALEWVSPDLHVENQLEIISDLICAAAEISSLMIFINPPMQAIAGNIVQKRLDPHLTLI